jgi:hypothetical protein
MVYQYKGVQTIAAEEEWTRKIAELQRREELAHMRELKAIVAADKLKERAEVLAAKVERLRKDKKALHSRIVGLKKVRPTPPADRDPGPLPADLSGPAGLRAAAEEVARFEARRRQERRAA